jgi:hypothetical protein
LVVCAGCGVDDWMGGVKRGRREGVIDGDGKGKRHVYSYRCCERVVKICALSGTDHCRFYGTILAKAIL